MVIQGRYETSKTLEQIGVIGGRDMTTGLRYQADVLLGEYGLERPKEKINKRWPEK